MAPTALWLRERFDWMGSHSGYDQLCEAITEAQPGCYRSVWRDPYKRLPKGSSRFLARLSRNVQTSSFYNLTSTAAEVGVLWQCFRYHPQIVHVTYVENHLGILPVYNLSRNYKIIGTAHQPVSWWRLVHPHPKAFLLSMH